LTYPSEKYEFVNGKDDIPYMKWKIKAMFQTTNQSPSSSKLTPNFANYGAPRATLASLQMAEQSCETMGSAQTTGLPLGSDLVPSQ
jgi:hypothetical protein